MGRGRGELQNDTRIYQGFLRHFIQLLQLSQKGANGDNHCSYSTDGQRGSETQHLAQDHSAGGAHPRNKLPNPRCSSPAPPSLQLTDAMGRSSPTGPSPPCQATCPVPTSPKHSTLYMPRISPTCSLNVNPSLKYKGTNEAKKEMQKYLRSCGYVPQGIMDGERFLVLKSLNHVNGCMGKLGFST